MVGCAMAGFRRGGRGDGEVVGWGESLTGKSLADYCVAWDARHGCFWWVYAGTGLT